MRTGCKALMLIGIMWTLPAGLPIIPKLPAGEYVFQLRATNENGDWGDVREMEIIIEPPFWATWWAYFIYVLLAILFMVLIWWEIRRRLLLRNRRFLQEGETDKVHHLKLQFLTNIPRMKKVLQDAVACVNRHLDDPVLMFRSL